MEILKQYSNYMLFQVFFNSTMHLLIFYKNIKLHNDYDIWIHEFCIEAPTCLQQSQGLTNINKSNNAYTIG
jgi:hypothetical protein